MAELFDTNLFTTVPNTSQEHKVHFQSPMRTILTLLVLCSTLFHSKAQIDSARIITFYKKIKYQVDTISLKETKLKLIIARPKSNNSVDESPVWLHSDATVPKDTYINSITSETGIYIPAEQPLKDFYLIVSCSEGYGNIVFIDKKGNLTSIPGYEFAIDKTTGIVYTKAPRDGEYIAGKFDSKTKKLETKPWTNTNGEPWGNNLNYYKIKTADWIK